MFLQAYIDFELNCGERERTRQLYERLLERTRHVKVWMSYAQFEEQPMPLEEAEEGEEESEEEAAARAVANEQGEEAPEVRAIRARGVYERAYR
eukprot:350471-Prorocentrum_minimum.AAC.1